jgi:3-hydroxyisobutyrate dehydrogenase
MGAEADELYQRFVDRGGTGKDFSGVIKMIGDQSIRSREHKE